MAQQTKSKSSASSGSRSNRRNPPASGRTAAKSRSSASRSQNAGTSQRKSRPRASSGRTKASSSNDKGAVEAAKDATAKGANTAGNAVTAKASRFVKKAKTPLIAGGVAIAGVAGVAGAAALNNARSRRRKVLGVPMPRGNGLKNLDARKIAGAVSDGAKRADRFGQRVSGVASSVQTVSETADKAAKKA